MTREVINIAREDRLITANELRDLHNNPVSILTCPLNSVILPHRITFTFTPGTESFNSHRMDVVVIQGEVQFGKLKRHIFNQTEVAFGLIIEENLDYVMKSEVINQDLTLYNKQSQTIYGDGTLGIKTWYSTFKLEG
jgi:hypothetical protein